MKNQQQNEFQTLKMWTFLLWWCECQGQLKYSRMCDKNTLKKFRIFFFLESTGEKCKINF